MAETRRAVISALELCRVRYPGALSTSGAARDYLQRLDTVFRGSGYRATVESRWDGGVTVLNDAESAVYNVPAESVRRVVRRWID